MSEDAALTLSARIPAGLEPAVAEGARAAAEARVPARLHAGDATLWGPSGTPEIGDRLGWLTIAERMRGAVDELEAFARQVREDGIEHVVLLGMGGSSLAPEVLRRCFAPREGHPRLHVLDSTDAAAVRAVGALAPPQRTLYLVSSKSGGTIEPLSLFAHFWSLAADGGRFAAITDPGTGLEKLAREHSFRRVFHGDPAIGGRYSALSAFGLVPAALLGIDLRGLLQRAGAAWEVPLQADALEGPGAAAVWLGVALGALARTGRDKLTFLIGDSFPGLGLWLEQLVAESTGKRGTGILPVAEEPPGAPRDYRDDRVFAHVVDVGSPPGELEGLTLRLAEAGHPVFTIPARSGDDLGRLFMLWELAVASAGFALKINPFDQPNVQQAKDATARALEGFERRGELEQAADAGEGALEALLDAQAPPQYVAIMAYAQPSGAFDEAAARLRTAIRARSGAATTFGYGPRFLHSTGQFHKGGPPTGRFLQLLHDGELDVEIPGRPYGFTTLKNAQATGDLSTLRELGLPAERLRLRGADGAGALRELSGAIEAKAGSAA